MTEHQPNRRKFQLRDKLGLGPRGFAALPEEERVVILERESRELIANGIELTQIALKNTGQRAFLAAVYRYFPEGLRGLQSRLNAEARNPQKPRGYWLDQINIETQAKQVLEEHGSLSAKLLKDIGMGDLLGAAHRNYPGKLHGLKKSLDYNPRKPRGYYTPEQTEEDARAFLEKYGRLSQDLMAKEGQSTLAGATSRYPGGIRALRAKLVDDSPKNQEITPEAANADLDSLLGGDV